MNNRTLSTPFSQLLQCATNIIAVSLLFVVVSVAIKPAHAQFENDWTNGKGYADAVDEAIKEGKLNVEAYRSSGVAIDMIKIGCDITPELGICTNDPAILSEAKNKSAIGSISKYIALLYTQPPARTSYFIADIGQTLGFMPKTYAQGIGFSGLAPLLPIWKMFRNIAYLLLTVVMVVIGFMVMLRKKIDPKTVVTVQNALPRIVVTLLLITFSYAIVGIMIDLMYLIITVFVNIIVSASAGKLGSDTLPSYIGGGFWSLLAAVFGNAFSASDDLAKMLIPDIAQFRPIIALGSGIVFFLVAILLLFGFIRIFFMLLNSYIQIIISLFVGPLQLLFDALPGGNGFSSWLKNLVVNLSAFPITAIMLLIGSYINRLNPEDAIWTPPLLSAGGGVHGINALIGLGIIMTIPSIVGSLREALKAQPAINAGPGAMIGPLAGGLGQIFNLVYQGSFIRSAISHKPDTRSPVQQAMQAQQGGLKTIVGGETH